MTGEPLEELALRNGVALAHRPQGYTEEQKISILRKTLELVGVSGTSDECPDAPQPPILEAPPGVGAYLPDWMESSRAWGIAIQLYELRSRRNWGIGDFADLSRFCAIAGSAGADFVGINPVHALFLAEPTRCSPFSPSSRRFLNPIYIAVDRVRGYSSSLADEGLLATLREAKIVDYAGVTAEKLRVLRLLWAADSSDRNAFAQFKRENGAALQRHALFEALSLRMVEQGYGSGWTSWPEAFHDVDGSASRAFTEAEAGEIEFQMWLQFVAFQQLQEASSSATGAGMRIGLYLDVAVGETPDGSARWSEPQRFVANVSIGAPPDVFTADGQHWGLAPPAPAMERTGGLEAYRRMVEAAARHAGAIRIDHAMSLWQLFFVPEDGVPAQGAYVRYPIGELLRIVADISHAERSIVIGEDLGYVPEGFREVMHAARILSYRILYFENDGTGFFAPGNYPRMALACLSTHDLPTLRGWWRADDIRLRAEYGLIEAATVAAQIRDRSAERFQIVHSLATSGALPPESVADAEASASDPDSGLPAAIMAAAHRFIAQTPCLLAVARLADLAGEEKPTNLPGTVDSYPNWRLKSSVYLEELASAPFFALVTGAMAAERPKNP